MSDRMYDFLLNLAQLCRDRRHSTIGPSKTRSSTQNFIYYFCFVTFDSHTLSRLNSTLRAEDVIRYDGDGPGRRDAPVGVLVELVIDIADTFPRYESIKTVTKPTEKQEGQLGGWDSSPSSCSAKLIPARRVCGTQ